jgi:hypothetical protein
MKLQELVEMKKTPNSNKVKMIISEDQFRKLSDSIYQNVLNEQGHKIIKNTHLIKIKRNENKN